MMPAQADPVKPATYLQRELEPRLAEAQAEPRAGSVVDAASFVLAPCLGFLGSFMRVFIPAPAPVGRPEPGSAPHGLSRPGALSEMRLGPTDRGCAPDGVVLPTGLTPSWHQAALDSWLTLKFQTFEKAQFVPA